MRVFDNLCLSCKEEECKGVSLAPGELGFTGSIGTTVNDQVCVAVFAALTMNFAFQTAGFLNTM